MCKGAMSTLHVGTLADQNFLEFKRMLQRGFIEHFKSLFLFYTLNKTRYPFFKNSYLAYQIKLISD